MADLCEREVITLNPLYFCRHKWKVLFLTLQLLLLETFGAHRTRLSLWIDKEQVSNFIGMPMQIYIILDGDVAPYLLHPGFDRHIPGIPPHVDTVNLTWEAGDEVFNYWFDDLKSLDQNVLYNPLLSIPAAGIIPAKTEVFQMAIPCTGNKEGVASLILGLQIFDIEGNPIKGSPIKLRLRKRCREFVTTSLCLHECQNDGRCNQFGECECKQGFYGKFCEIAMCFPSCVNNGTCISPDKCICPDGFYGKQCEIVLCAERCQNGGRCVQVGLCWCTNGFYGESCQYSECYKPCKHGGRCTGRDQCECPPGYTGDQCEKAACRKPCAHGQCVDDGVCECAVGWRGRYCHKRAKRLGKRAHETGKGDKRGKRRTKRKKIRDRRRKNRRKKKFKHIKRKNQKTLLDVVAWKRDKKKRGRHRTLTV